MKLASRKPKHPVAPKELADAMLAIRADSELEAGLPHWLQKWEYELNLAHNAKAGNHAVVIGMLGLGAEAIGQTPPPISAIWPQQELPIRLVASFELVVKTMLSCEKDMGNDPSKD